MVRAAQVNEPKATQIGKAMPELGPLMRQHIGQNLK